METDIEGKVVRVTAEDHRYIEELYERINEAYKSLAEQAGIKPSIGKKGHGPKMRHVITFLREHAVFGDRMIREFAARFVK